MGYLTTITIRNDALSTIKDNKDDFMRNLLEFCSCCGISAHNYPDYFSVGNFANPIVLQRPRPADDHTIYVHMGNTVVEMNSSSKDTQERANSSPVFFEEALKFLDNQVKSLKKLKGRK